MVLTEMGQVRMKDGLWLTVLERESYPRLFSYKIGFAMSSGFLVHNAYGVAELTTNRPDIRRPKWILEWLEENIEKEKRELPKPPNGISGRYCLFGLPIDCSEHEKLGYKTTEELARIYLQTTKYGEIEKEIVLRHMRRLFSWDEKTYKVIRAAALLVG